MNIKNLLTAVLLTITASATAQLKVGNNPTTINANSVLEVESTNKGLLLPRLALTGTANVTPLAAHVAGMTVYNTATTGDVNPGYYYNDGAKWVRIVGVANQTSSNTPNIYTADGTLAANRTVTFGTNTLDFAQTGVGNLQFNRGHVNTNPRIYSLDTVELQSNANPYQLNLLPNGNVGIGTSAPTTKLEVGGTILSSGAASVNRQGTQITWNDATLSFPLSGMSNFLNHRGTGPGGYTFSGTNNNSTFQNYMTILGNGNVGIGTTTPNGKLQFANDLANRKIVLWEDANNDQNYYGFGIGDAHLRYQVAGPLGSHRFLAATSANTELELMRIQGNGNVGIGTAVPASKLDVYGGIIAGSYNPITTQGSHLQWNKSGIDGETWLLNQQGNGNGGIRFGKSTITDNVTEWARFNNNGFLGIGTSNPLTKLDVNQGLLSISALFDPSAVMPTTDNRLVIGWNTINAGFGEVDFANYSGTGGGQSFRFHRLGGSNVTATNASVIATIGGTGVYTQVSDARVKSNIQGIGYGLKEIMALNPVSYNRHTDLKFDNGNVTYTDKGINNIGFLAQELYKVIPEAVVKPADDKKELWSVAYTDMIPVLVKAVQEQQAQIDAQKAEIKKLKDLIKSKVK